MRGIYEGTVGEREYAHGRDEGREAAESLACGTYSLGDVWEADARDEADWRTATYRTRAYALGWLRGYRELTR